MFLCIMGELRLAGRGSLGKAGNEMSKAVEMYLSQLQNIFDLSNVNLMKAFPAHKSQPWTQIKLMRHIIFICWNLQMYLSKLSNVFVPIAKHIWPLQWQLNEGISCWQKSTLATNKVDETYNIREEWNGRDYEKKSLSTSHILGF